MDGSGNVFVGGSFRGSIDLDPASSASGDTLSSQGGTDGFVTKLGRVADLIVGVSDTPDPVVRGTDLTYSITVQNAGPGLAASATLTVPLPVGTTFVSVTPPSPWLCGPLTVGTNGTLSCTNASFAVGSAAFTVVMHVDPSVPPASTLTSLVTLSAATADSS